MKKLLLLLTIFTAISIASFAQWGTLATDASGDGSQGGATYLDGTKLEYRYDNMTDSIWFRVTVSNVLNSNYGLNIVLDVEGAGSTASWFGGNSNFRYNRLITAWITSGTSGTVGISDPSGVASSNYKKLHSDNINISIDATNKTYTLGLKRTDIYNDTVLKADVIAATGSNQFWDDDVPNVGSGGLQANPSLNVGSIHIIHTGLTIYPNPTSGIININRTNAEKPADVNIYNPMGQMVYRNEIEKSNHKHMVDLSLQPSGLYFISVKSADNDLTQSVILK